MKIISELKNVAILMLCIVCMTSCEKSEEDLELSNADLDEAYISNTGNSDISEPIKESENVKVVLHMTFDDSTNEEEALEAFEKATAKYLRETSNDKAASKFRYRVKTRTSSTNHYGTDAPVYARIKFFTDKGHRVYTKRLDNPNKNDFEEGKTDYFLLSVTPSSSLCWATVNPIGSSLRLKGTDGWGVLQFTVDMTAQMQYSNSATGYSSFNTYPNVLLDNISENYWDEYVIDDYNDYTGAVGFNCN